MVHRKSLFDWKQQLGADKRAYEGAKKNKKLGRSQQTGYKIIKGKKRPLYEVEYYGKLYRQSLAGYRRAMKKVKLAKVI